LSVGCEIVPVRSPTLPICKGYYGDFKMPSLTLHCASRTDQLDKCQRW